MCVCFFVLCNRHWFNKAPGPDPRGTEQGVLQQQHVDHKIANALLKKGTREAYKKWNLQDRDWVDMRLHESHDEGGFSVPNNTISRHAAAYTTKALFVVFLGTFARPAQEVWLPGNDIQDPTTWSVPSLRTLKHLHETLLQDYDCTEQPAADLPAQPSGAGGSAAANAGAPPPPPSARAQDASSGTLVLPAAKASALRINLNIQGCSVVAPSLHAPSRAPLLRPLLLSHNIPLPRVH